MTDAPRVSRERLAEMLADWENNSAASRSHDLDTRYADEHASAIRELLALRTPAQEAGDVVDLIRTYGNASWCEGAGQTNDAGSADELEARLIAIVRSSPAASPVTVEDIGVPLDDIAVIRNHFCDNPSALFRDQIIELCEYAMGYRHIQQPAEPVCETLPDVDALAQIIRTVDGNHDLGAGALAEAILRNLAARK
jgi:hypothetical protein